MTLFANLDPLPLHAARRIFEAFLVDGFHVIFRVILALLRRLQPILLAAAPPPEAGSRRRGGGRGGGGMHDDDNPDSPSSSGMDFAACIEFLHRVPPTLLLPVEALLAEADSFVSVDPSMLAKLADEYAKRLATEYPEKDYYASSSSSSSSSSSPSSKAQQPSPTRKSGSAEGRGPRAATMDF